MTEEEIEKKILHAFRCMLYDLGEINWKVLKPEAQVEYINKDKSFNLNQVEDIKYLYDTFVEIHEKSK